MVFKLEYQLLPACQPWDLNWDISSVDFGLAILHNHISQFLTINPFTYVYIYKFCFPEYPNTEQYHYYTETIQIPLERIQILLESQREGQVFLTTMKVICKYILGLWYLQLNQK